MKWTDYPTRQAFNERNRLHPERGDHGIGREGQVWSEGPRAGTVWVKPSDGQGGGERTSGCVLVTRRGGDRYRILSEENQ